MTNDQRREPLLLPGEVPPIIAVQGDNLLWITETGVENAHVVTVRSKHYGCCKKMAEVMLKMKDRVLMAARELKAVAGWTAAPRLDWSGVKSISAALYCWDHGQAFSP